VSLEFGTRNSQMTRKPNLAIYRMERVPIWQKFFSSEMAFFSPVKNTRFLECDVWIVPDYKVGWIVMLPDCWYISSGL
jgi:hypothetical protein